MDFSVFAFTGFRSFSAERSLVLLGERSTIVLGPNNAGKSSLVYLIQNIDDIVESARGNSRRAVLSDRFDRPRSPDGSAEDTVFWLPVDLEGLASKHNLAGHQVDLLMGSDLFLSHGKHWLLRFDGDWESGGLQLGLDSDRARQIQNDGSSRQWSDLSSKLTSTGGGALGDDVKRVHSHFARQLTPAPKVGVVPPAREMTAGATSEEWDFSGTGMINRVDQLLNPEFDDDEARQMLESIESMMADLLEQPGFRLGIPQDKQTLNVKLNGSFYALESVGTGIAHALIIVIAAIAFDKELLILEEPDAHMHPRLQARLFRTLREVEGLRTLTATHSAHLVDIAYDTILGVLNEDGRSTTRSIAEGELFDHLSNLGYRASTILQSNCIIWVEGPSDRIYLRYWMQQIAPDLVEGADFTFMHYGGSLLSRLTADAGSSNPDLIALHRVNQNMFLVTDSDKAVKEDQLKPAVKRLQAEVVASGRGGVWISAGYTIENYLPAGDLLDAATDAHPTVTTVSPLRKNRNPLLGLHRKNGSALKQPDKVAIAESYVRLDRGIPDRYDLRERIDEVVRFVRRSNDGPRLS